MCTIYFYLYLLLILKYMYCQLCTFDPEVHLTSDTFKTFTWVFLLYFKSKSVLLHEYDVVTILI